MKRAFRVALIAAVLCMMSAMAEAGVLPVWKGEDVFFGLAFYQTDADVKQSGIAISERITDVEGYEADDYSGMYDILGVPSNVFINLPDMLGDSTEITVWMRMSLDEAEAKCEQIVHEIERAWGADYYSEGYTDRNFDIVDRQVGEQTRNADLQYFREWWVGSNHLNMYFMPGDEDMTVWVFINPRYN